MEGTVKDKGNKIGNKSNVSLDKCGEICDTLDECKSFSYNLPRRACYLRDKQLFGREELVKKNSNNFSVFKVCIESK